MAVLNEKDFMDKIKAMIGDKNDDETLSFLEDAKDTISSLSDDYKKKYDDLLIEKDNLDKAWREKYKSRFFDDTDINNNNHNDNHNNNNNNPFDTRTEEEKKAESISIDDLFTDSK